MGTLNITEDPHRGWDILQSLMVNQLMVGVGIGGRTWSREKFQHDSNHSFDVPDNIFKIYGHQWSSFIISYHEYQD